MTKRLFAYLGLTMLSVYTAVFYFGVYGLCAAGVFAAALLVYALAVKNPVAQKSVIILISVVTVVSAAVFTVYDNEYRNKAALYDNQTVTMTATVKSDGQKRYGVYNYETDAIRIDSENTNIRVMLSSNFMLNCEYGDTIRAKVHLTKCDENYYRSRRFVYTAKGEDYKLNCKVIKSGNKDIGYAAVYVKNRLSDDLQTMIKGDNGDLCAAMTFGARERLSSELNAMFSKTGLSFLIVVSGLHMSIISMLILLFLKPLGKRRFGNFIRAAAVVIFVILYMMITGMTASVVRSGVAVILPVLATAFRRRSDAYNNLGMAAILLTAKNPYAVGDLGMLLSFSSVLGIVYLFPKMSMRFQNYYYAQRGNVYLEIKRTNQTKRKLRFGFEGFLLRVTHYLFGLFFVAFSAIAASMPVMFVAVGNANPAALFFSIVLTPLTTLIVWLAFLTAVLLYIPVLGFLAYISGILADISAGIMISVVRYFDSVPYLTFYIDRATAGLWILSFVVFTGAAILSKQKKRNLLIAFVLSLVFLAGSCATEYFIHANTLTLRVIGSGSPSVAISGSGVEALLSYGGDYNKFDALCTKLHSSCGDVKTLIIPDNSLKTSRFALNIMDEFDVKSVMLYHSNRTALDLEEKAMSVNEYDEFYTADTVALSLGQGVTDTIINDGKSTWQYVSCRDMSVLIAPEKADASRLPAKYSTAKVIVCGSEIKNIDNLTSSGNCWITASDLSNDMNIRLR